MNTMQNQGDDKYIVHPPRQEPSPQESTAQTEEQKPREPHSCCCALVGGAGLSVPVFIIILIEMIASGEDAEPIITAIGCVVLCIVLFIFGFTKLFDADKIVEPSGTKPPRPQT